MKRVISLLFLFGIMVVLSTPAWAVSMRDFRLNGFLDLEFEKSYSDDASIGDTKGSFDQAHFNLLMEFHISDNLSAKGHIEYEHAAHYAFDEGKGDGEINIDWAYIEYLLSNSIRFRGGMVLTPFGIYNEIHDATPTFASVRIPWGIYNAEGAGGFSMFPIFSTGVNLLGNYFTEGDLNLNYVIYIGNGENDPTPTGTHEAESDDNSNKAIGGRLTVSPLSGLNLGGSYYTGKIGTAKKDHSAWDVSLDYSRFPLDVRAEYASSKLENTTEKGWYGEASYRIGVITPFLRYGTLDPDDDVADDKWTEIVYGINYEIQPKMVLKLENRQFGGNPNNTSVSDDYNEIAAAVTVAF